MLKTSQSFLRKMRARPGDAAYPLLSGSAVLQEFYAALGSVASHGLMGHPPHSNINSTNT